MKKYLLVKKIMEREKYIYIIYILHVCFGILKKTLPASYAYTQLFETLANISMHIMKPPIEN